MNPSAYQNRTRVFESENRCGEDDFEDEQGLKEAFEALKQIVSVHGSYKFEDEADIIYAAIDVIKTLEGEVRRRIKQGTLTPWQMEKLRNPYYVSVCFVIQK